MERFAPAKVNLALHVLGRRPDGYNDLDTLAVFAEIGDGLRFRAAEDLTLAISGPLAEQAPPGDVNLVLRAAKLLKERSGFPGGAAVELEKNLPAGAGFGGASADAAATLHGLNTLWELPLGLDELLPLGQALGADVPMCLVARALRARGKGERIEAIDGWPALPMVLVWPARQLATASVFAELTPSDNPPLPDAPFMATPAALAAWLAACRNDLEQAALRLAPEAGAALERLRATDGCLLARMSGSGSGCFGLYAAPAQAAAASLALQCSEPSWWVVATLAG